MENLGFTKVVDFVSSYIEPHDFNLPEKVRKAAEIAKKRGTFEVVEFGNKKELVSGRQKLVKPIIKHSSRTGNITL